MSKMDDAKAKAKKILEEMEANHTANTAGSADTAGNGSATEIHVENHSESTVTGGTVLQDASGQVAELTADIQRLQAEFANYKRRAEVERADTIDFAKGRVVREFLAVRDSFDSELAHR